MGLLRGPADRERHARRPPHRGPRLQGRLSPFPHHARLPRGPQGRLGLPRPARRARRREGARLQRQAGHRGVRHRRVQRQVPRVRDPPHRRVHRAHHPDGLLGRPGRRVPDHGPRVRRVRVVVAEGDLQQGPAGPGPPRRPLVPALRHRPVRPRAGPGLRDGRRPLGLRPLPADLRPAGRRGGAPRLDDDPLDPGVQHRRRRPPRGPLRRRHERHREAGRRPAAAGEGPRRGLGGHRRDLHRRRDGALDLPAPLRAGALRVPGPLRGQRRLRHHRGRHGSGPPGPGLRRRRPRGLPRVRPAGREPGPPRRHLRRGRPAGRRRLLQEGRREADRRPRRPRPALQAHRLRAQLPALLALPHRAALLRAAVLVHPHHRRQGRDAAGEREDQLVPRVGQAGPLRRLAEQQHRLGAVPQPLLGHPAADLALRGGPPHLHRLARRADRAVRHRPVGPGPAPPVHRRRHLPLHGGGLLAHRGPRPGGHRRLVRLGLDAVRAVGLPVQEQGRLREALPGAVHLGGDRPDPRVVLHPHGGRHPGLRQVLLRERRLPRPHPRRGRPQDVQAPGQHPPADPAHGPARRGRGALVHGGPAAPRGRPVASATAPSRRSSARRC